MMSVKIEPMDAMSSLSSPSDVIDLVIQNGSNGVDSVSGVDSNHSASIATTTATLLSIDQKPRDLETTVISLAPAQPYPSGTALTFAPAYDLSGQTQYTVQVNIYLPLPPPPPLAPDSGQSAAK
jgi:hypothetical protein